MASDAAVNPKVPVTGVAVPNPLSQLSRRWVQGSDCPRTLPSDQG